MMLIFAGTSFLAGPLYNRVGARFVTGAGGVCLTASALGLALAITSDYPLLIPCLLLAGIGVGLYYSAITTVSVTASAPRTTASPVASPIWATSPGVHSG